MKKTAKVLVPLSALLLMGAGEADCLTNLFGGNGSGGGQIACSPGTANCDGDEQNGCEVNSNDDPANCAACGVVCQEPGGNRLADCDNGRCGAGRCAEGYKDCAGDSDCESPVNDAANCGACGHACPGGTDCWDYTATLPNGTQTRQYCCVRLSDYGIVSCRTPQ